MRKLRRIDIEGGGEVIEKLEAYVKRVVEAFNPRMVILFGSLATGDLHEGSDVDVAVIADFREGFLDRVKRLMELNTFGIPIEPVGYTPSEVEEMIARGNRFILEVLEKGRVLYKATGA